MSWFKRNKAPMAVKEEKKGKAPEGLWTKCPSCSEVLVTKDIEANLNVCPKCSHHYRISAQQRIELLLDENSFKEYDAGMVSVDFLEFKDSKSYKSRIDAAVAKGGSKDAIICGEGTVDGLTVQLAVFDFSFMGGAWGALSAKR